MSKGPERYIMKGILYIKGGKIMPAFTLDIKSEAKHLLFMMSIIGNSAVEGTSVSFFS